MTMTDRVRLAHADARAKLAAQKRGTRQHDYWQGVYDALHNLLHKNGG